MQNKFNVYGKRTLLILFVVFSFLACIKCIFFGLNVDEEYAVTMAYRILGEDSMFYTMWEPHQTSGFLCALLLKPFLAVNGGGTDYMVIYLRTMGILIHAGVCTYVYFGLKHICSRYEAFLLSLLCFSILPKWTLIPEFSNILLWVTLCMMACFLQIQHARVFRVGWFLFLGILTCVGVLAYPSFLLCFIVYAIGICYVVSDRRKTALAVYVITCAGIGICYLVFFAGSLGIDVFLKGIFQMATDGQHATPFISKLADNSIELVKCIGIYAVLYALACLLAKVLKKDVKRSAFLLLSMGAVLWQLLVWLGKSEYLYEPMTLFYHIFLVILMSCAMTRKEVLLYILPPVAAVLAAGALTNTGIYVISFFLLPAVVYGLARLAGQNRREVGIVMVALAGLFLFAKGWLLCEAVGYKADMFYVKQKALSGPAKNIYCRYLDGYEYNIVQELMDVYVEEDDDVLCVSGHTLWYLLADVNISNFSTISTPTYDERLLEYYSEFPEKYPDVIILQEVSGYENVLELFELEEPVAEREGIYLYFTSRHEGEE